MIQTTKYVRNPVIVEAVQVTEENFAELAVWCQGEIRRQKNNEPIKMGESTLPLESYIWVRVSNPKSARQTKAYVGDWLLYTERGFKVFTDFAFRRDFGPLPDHWVEAQPSQ